ncbi:PAS domain-containing protein, partial [Streptomyces sp. NPDC001633]|uniref:PAS domain-containing protein n=1 Tax=Streptomyces sp. NPDC001633 TaxID=3364595 RepID=UPI0036A252CF
MRDATPGGGSGAVPPDPSGPAAAADPPAPAAPADPATAVVDDRGVVTGWSAGAERLLGYPCQEAVGSPVSRLIASDGLAAPAGSPATALFRHRDGRTLPLWVRAYPWVDGVGRAQRLLVVTPPESPAPPRPDAVTGDEAFAQCRVVLMVYDSALRVVRASAGAVRELGLREERMLGRRVTDILPPHLCHRVEEGMVRVLTTGEPEEFRLRGRVRPDGPERVWSVTVSPLLTPAGRVRHVEVSALDVSEQYLARERLALLNDISARVGSTLDVMRTAQELADFAVPRFADLVLVDLLEPVARPEEPGLWPGDPGHAPPGGLATPLSGRGAVRTNAASSRPRMRRAAMSSVREGVPEAVCRIGDLVDFVPPPYDARFLVEGEPVLIPVLESLSRLLSVEQPARAERIHEFGLHSL